MTLADPQTRRWTRDEYYQIADLGFFQDQRVELIEGEIIEMAPQKDVHAGVTGLVQRALENAFDVGYWVRVQLPLHFTNISEPEPDIAVVQGGPRDYIGTGHPRTALLVVEVSEATLRFDRGKKARLYAAAGIAEYWIVNLIDKCVEVHRFPGGDAYTDIKPYKSGESISPLNAAQGAAAAVLDILP
jgi:Uma2 family endonuclease